MTFFNCLFCLGPKSSINPVYIACPENENYGKALERRSWFYNYGLSYTENNAGRFFPYIENSVDIFIYRHIVFKSGKNISIYINKNQRFIYIYRNVCFAFFSVYNRCKTGCSPSLSLSPTSSPFSFSPIFPACLVCGEDTTLTDTLKLVKHNHEP